MMCVYGYTCVTVMHYGTVLQLHGSKQVLDSYVCFGKFMPLDVNFS